MEERFRQADGESEDEDEGEKALRLALAVEQNKPIVPSRAPAAAAGGVRRLADALLLLELHAGDLVAEGIDALVGIDVRIDRPDPQRPQMWPAPSSGIDLPRPPRPAPFTRTRQRAASGRLARQPRLEVREFIPDGAAVQFREAWPDALVALAPQDLHALVEYRCGFVLVEQRPRDIPWDSGEVDLPIALLRVGWRWRHRRRLGFRRDTRIRVHCVILFG